MSCVQVLALQMARQAEDWLRVHASTHQLRVLRAGAAASAAASASAPSMFLASLAGPPSQRSRAGEHKAPAADSAESALLQLVAFAECFGRPLRIVSATRKVLFKPQASLLLSSAM